MVTTQNVATRFIVVVTTFPFTAASQDVLREAAGAEVLFVHGQQALVDHLAEAEILCTYSVPANWRERAPHLRWLQYPGAGVDALRSSGLLDANSGVLVTTATGIHAETISEYVFGSMLMFNWNWPQMVRLQDRHIWARSASWYNLGGRELAGQTLGVVGLGHIGRRVAQLGHAFGMRVLGVRRSVHAPVSGEDDGELRADAGDTRSAVEGVDALYAPDQLHEMLGLCDYVVLAVPLTRETEKMIGEAELRAMRPHAYLVNIARGRVVDEQALIRGLKEGWIAGAGLDVTEEEPLPTDSPLYSMPNVILTPHISGASIHYDARLAALFAENLRRYRAGEPLLNLYDAARGY
jgi:phosphoglycerate dehydrogenase-like enzyme